jgi:hypothetical protein
LISSPRTTATYLPRSSTGHPERADTVQVRIHSHSHSHSLSLSRAFPLPHRFKLTRRQPWCLASNTMHCQNPFGATSDSAQQRVDVQRRGVSWRVVSCRGVVDGHRLHTTIRSHDHRPHRTAPRRTARHDTTRNGRGRAGYKSFVYILDSNPTCFATLPSVVLLAHPHHAPRTTHPTPHTPRSTPSTRRERIDRRHLRYPEVSVKMRRFTSCSSAGDGGVSIDSTYASARAARVEAGEGRVGRQEQGEMKMKVVIAVAVAVDQRMD